jgi:predicted TIM-barrel fold metal-dependent hydrolase
MNDGTKSPGGRIDVHHHVVPPQYAAFLASRGLSEVGGRSIPKWTLEDALSLMDLVDITTAMLSVSAPGTTHARDRTEAASIARDVNDFVASLVADRPDRFGLLATVPMADVKSATREAVRALDHLNADGVILLANAAGTYLGSPEHDELFAELDARSAVVFVHPAVLQGPEVPGVPPFAADFLLDTTRAVYLLVRNGVLTRYPHIRFILSHAGGFVPYAAHRLAVSLAADSHVSILDILEQFRSFYFDTALSSSPAALPTLLAFARPKRILFGSDWPFVPTTGVQYFANGLDTYALSPEARTAICSGNAAALFPRLGVATTQIPVASARDRLVHGLQRATARAIFRLVQPN